MPKKQGKDIKLTEAPAFNMLKTLLLGLVFFYTICLCSASAIRTTGIILIILAIMVGVLRFNALKERFGAVLIFLSCWVGISGISVFYSSQISDAFLEFLKISSAFCILILITAIDFKKNEGAFTDWAGILSVAAALLGIASIDLFSTKIISSVLLFIPRLFAESFNTLTAVEIGTRMNSILGNPNIFASCVGIGVLISLGLVSNEEGKAKRLLYTAVLYACSLAFVLAFSMGASIFIALAFLIFLFVERSEKRGSLLLIMLETFIMVLPAAILISATSFDGNDAFNVIPTLSLIVGSALLCFVNEKLRLKPLHFDSKKTMILVGSALGGLVLYIVLAVSITAPAYIQADSSLSRAAYPAPGEYTLSADVSAPVNVMVRSQNQRETMIHEYNYLYEGDINEAKFTVPDDSLVVYFVLLTEDEGVNVNSLSYVGEKESGALPLHYPLLPGFIANRLQGLFANQNAIQRVVFFTDGLKLFAKSPLLGLGLDAFQNFGNSVKTFDYASKYIHNHYIETLANTGIIGFALFMGATICLAITLKKNIKDNAFAPALASATIFAFGHALVELNFQNYAALICIFALIAIINLSCKEKITLPAVVEKAKPAIIGIIATGLAAFCVLLIISASMRATISSKPTIANLEKAVKSDLLMRDEYMTNYIRSAGKSEHKEDYAMADEYAIKLEGITSTTIPFYLSEYYFRTDRPEKAFQMLEELLLFSPSDPNRWEETFVMLEYFYEDNEVFNGGVKMVYEMMEEWNSSSINPIVLPEEQSAFIGRVLK